MKSKCYLKYRKNDDKCGCSRKITRRKIDRLEWTLLNQYLMGQPHLIAHSRHFLCPGINWFSRIARTCKTNSVNSAIIYMNCYWSGCRYLHLRRLQCMFSEWPWAVQKTTLRCVFLNFDTMYQPWRRNVAIAKAEDDISGGNTSYALDFSIEKTAICTV